MRQARNPFSQRRSESIETDAAFLNLFEPGILDILTEGLAQAGPGAQQAAASAMPMQRIGQPEEVADAVVWLCSDLASFVNGQVLGVEGGFLTR